MAKRRRASPLAKAFSQGLAALTRSTMRVGRSVAGRALKPTIVRLTKPSGVGDWLSGMAAGPTGVRSFKVYRPPAIAARERLPLLVMLHGCGQNANSFATSTRMNAVAARERFIVLYPEQDRIANVQGCWNWFDTRSGRAYGEAELIMNAIDQACLLYPVDGGRIAVAGLSAGASMAALLVSRHPERFKAVVMHSGVPPGTAHTGIGALGAMHGRRATAALPAGPANMAASWPPLLVIHGKLDPVVAPSNGWAAVEIWASAAGARVGTARAVQRGKRYPTTVTDFKCGRRVIATHVEVRELGHAWSGGAAKQQYADARGPDASRMVWAFASRQFRSLPTRGNNPRVK